MCEIFQSFSGLVFYLVSLFIVFIISYFAVSFYFKKREDHIKYEIKKLILEALKEHEYVEEK